MDLQSQIKSIRGKAQEYFDKAQEYYREDPQGNKYKYYRGLYDGISIALVYIDTDEEEFRMTKETFWDILTDERKTMIKEMFNYYPGSEGAEGRIFEMYEEGAKAAGVDIRDYLDPNDYVSYQYESYTEALS